MAKREELIEAVRERSRAASVVDKARTPNEFCTLAGYHCKHAILVLNRSAIPQGPTAMPRRNRIYDDVMRQFLAMLWDTGDKVTESGSRP